MLKKIIFFNLLFAFSAEYLYADKNERADTVHLLLGEAEKLFLQNNFRLLAAQFDVNASEAAIIQAKLYPNPTLSIDQGVYNSVNKSWMDMNKSGETSVSLQQVILLGGKRGKEINAAKINSRIAAFRFYDLIRELRFQLHTAFYGLYFLRQSISVFERELASLRSLITVYTEQFNKGNVSFKELARLEALQFGLENERMDLVKEADEKQSDIIVLTGDTLSRTIQPVVDPVLLTDVDPGKFSYLQLIDSAFKNRYDLIGLKTQVQLDENNLSLQKALRIPDLTLGANWDRQGSYVYNYNAVSIGIDLPFWNRNKGNIKMAQYQMEESKHLLLNEELVVKNEVRNVYTQLVESEKLFSANSGRFNADYDKLLEGITNSYREHTISLLEFIDYYETYKNSKIALNRLQNNLFNAVASLNFTTGTDFIK